ncbi:restriction endonuclease subunit S [Frateuria soli]|uniref:restriction endonuclease subunit S n=1 Tax=Frateuria soli TaxID=1542730 RepID=UPI001E40D856|nr:restriction endonuclease subunit S [Frateuria soli]UGB39662.1 restriction endonuclease subunit S [Frateuria soli]
MSLPRYSEYKDSNIEWLGEVPAHWEVAQLKRVLDIQNGADHKSIETDDGYPVIGSGGPFAYASKFIYDGESVLLGRKGTIDRPLHVTGKFWTVDTMYWTKISADACGRFCYYAALTIPFDFYSTNTALPSMTKGVLSAHPIALPPYDEQHAIATFLDRETAKIDALIAEQEKLLALLAEKRQATISHAVTRGLNPNVPMKDSGISWLGAVPAHWEMRRLKALSPAITVGIVVNPSDYISDAGLPFIYGGDISEGHISITSCRRIDPSDSDKQAKTRLSPGDLLTVRVGAPGVTAVVPEECAGGNCASVMLIRSGGFNSNWLCYAMNSRMVRYQVEVVQYGAAQEQFNIGHAVNFWIATPPREEQDTLAAGIGKAVERIDALKGQVEQAIGLLRERRSALISAAVSGKVDVREFALEGEVA